MKLLTTLFLAASTASSFAIAETTDPLEVTVTAKRYSSSTLTTASSTSVINREEIESARFANTTELLESLPGIYIARRGSSTSLSSVYLRGTESNHTVILVDGVRLITKNDGTADLSYLPIESIERVEVIRGSTSNLYGADAIGGVIQIFTTQYGNQSSITGSLGQDKYSSFSLRNSRKVNDKLSYGFSLSKKDSDGFNVTTNENLDQDKDGFHEQSGAMNFKFSHQNIETTYAGNFWIGENEYDNAFGVGNTDKESFRTYQHALNLRISAGNNVINGKVASQTNRSKNYIENDPTNDLYIDVDRLESGVTVETDFENGVMQTAGIEKVIETTKNDKRNTKSFFYSLEKNFKDQQINAGLRHDDSSQFGDETTYGLSYLYKINESTSVFTNYKTGISAPTFLDTDPSFGPYANPDLKPETSKGKELGIKYQTSGAHAEVVIFETEFENKIENNAYWQPQNIGRATSKGWEASSSLLFDRTEISADYTRTIAQKADGSRLLNRPMNQIGLKLTQDLSDKTDIALRGRWINDYLNVGSVEPVSGYSVWALSSTTKYNDSLTVNAKIDNIFDKQYEPIEGYAGKGRYLELTLSYKF